jgi:uncharacterized sulfatase
MKSLRPFFTFALLSLAPCTAALCVSPTPPHRPNILFILADDLGCAQVGAYGNDYYRTPHIDGLARDGVRFTRAYAAAPVCSPTRSALMTGRHPARTRVTNFIPGNPFPWARLQQPSWQKFLPLDELTVAEALADGGYTTALFGKWHLAKAYFPPASIAEGPDKQGFAETLITHKPTESTDPETDAHNVRAITDAALQFITRHRNEPFFLLLSHNTVHAPVMAPRALIETYPDGGDDHPENVPVMGAMMEMLDRSVGEVLAKLDELGLRENTLVIFYSDNGGLQSSAAQAPLRGGKAQLYEGGLRVPLLMRWPGVIAPGAVSDFATTTMDFFPTLLELAGISATPAASLDGISFASTLRTGSTPLREALYWHYPHYHPAGLGPSGAVLAGDWKLIESFEAGLTSQPEACELFNLRDDPGEKNNLSTAEPARTAALRAQLAAWRKSVQAQMPTLNPRYDPARAGELESVSALH